MNESLCYSVGQDVNALLPNLQMPNAGGFRLVSAMRNPHPPALTLVLNRDPQFEPAMSEMVLQADNF